MGFKSKIRNIKECAVNSMIYNTKSLIEQTDKESPQELIFATFFHEKVRAFLPNETKAE